MAPSTGIEPAPSCSTGSRSLQGTTRARRRSVVMVRRGGFAPPQPLTAGLRPAGLACARAGARSTTQVWLAMPIRFSRCGPGFSGQKEKGPGVARPLVDSFVSRESSNCSHRGDSGPGDARLGSCQRTMRVLAGYSRVGRRPQAPSRLRIPESSFCLWLSWHGGAYRAS
jgi:hypothetical protein